jgi:hypothetical protein
MKKRVQMRWIASGCALLGCVVGVWARPGAASGERGQVLALETAWNHALEVKDTRALDLLLADTMVALGDDGSLSTKKEYLTSIKAADFQPSQAVNEKSGVENRRSSGSLPVACIRAAFAERASVRFDMALFPVPAHRTGQAHLAHPALGERFTVLPTESCWSE